MKRQRQNASKVLNGFFARVARPSRSQVELSKSNIWQRLRIPSAKVGKTNSVPRMPDLRRRYQFAVVTAVAVVIAIVVVTAINPSRDVMAMAVRGALYRVSSGEPQRIQAGDKIERGAIIRSTGGGVFTMNDGSRVEMRDQSEVSLENAEEGTRIYLSRGGVVVSASGRREGHLYVRTKDVTASVIGSFALVSTEEEGSRVAVIQGEAQVQHGLISQKLLPGEQIITSPAMPSQSPASLAILQQSARLVGAAPEAFDAVSIRPSIAPPPVPGGRVGAGGTRPGGSLFPGEQPCFVTNRLQLNPGRLVVMRATLHGLIAAAYGVNCNLADIVAGEPDWAKSEHYDIQAVIPASSPVYTRTDLLEGNAPQLQRMLQRLLADRFKLTLRREIKEMAAYDLVVAKPAKWDCRLPVSCHGLRISEDQSADPDPTDREGFTAIMTTLNLHTSISAWTRVVSLNTNRPVIDKTGLKGFYDIRLEFPDVPGATSIDERDRNRELMRARFVNTIQEQLGFKLEASKALVEVLFVDHVEMPSEN